ncbi:MAG TPA: nickel pincer cofactor biosynthesis protein LarB [Spirochaetota bacterium]|nr:nickel pincer cofactor biosynthesis protein LarB [Spirochaetota bacterium]HNT12012.1 nickel pincer cofactor biosynthesis protein LarB [Spirochaetota bacterium]
MDEKKLSELLDRFRAGELSRDDIIGHLRGLPFEDLSFAKVDHHRALRWGFPEVIFCRGKRPDQVALIAQQIHAKGGNLLATRATPEMYEAVRERLPEATFDEIAGTISCASAPPDPLPGRCLIITAGTSDLPVAHEARETARMLGLDASLIADVGVAGIHRVLHFREELEAAAVIIVIAGMEGALPSVVAGLVTAPVIAVPTSIGYGTSFGGVTALLGMLNSCVPGTAVMNIDNGFGAAFLAFRIISTQKRIGRTQ